MAGVLRRLVTVLELRSREALAGLKLYDRTWKAVAKGVDAAAAQIERSADRAAAAMSRVSAGAAGVRAGAGGGGSRGGGGGRKGKDPLDAAIASANKAGARQAGLAAGAAPINDATKALGLFASASDRAKASVKDLEAQVSRNRKEMAELRVQVAKTGDADGTLTERMRGLATATGQTQVKLQGARGALREIEGGLKDVIKDASGLKATTVALGQVMATGFTVAARAVKDGLVGAATGAIDFESSMADVKKVLSAPDLKNFEALNQGVLDLSKNIGIAPKEVAALTASLAQSGIAGDELLKTAEDASKLAVAFGISGEESGQALAKLRTGLGLSRDEVNSLTGTINNLSNSLAATAPEITDAVQRVGSVAKAANISAESTAALVTSMIASGAGADVAATGTKNFIRALGAGDAATKKQAEAFAALGLSAGDTARNLSKGGKEAEATIKDVVRRISELRQEERLPVLIELFGSESIGAIGPLATNIELLGKSFDIAGDKVAAAGSVEAEFAARSATTATQIEKLKASAQVLAIEAGQHLLPILTRVAEWLSSPEVQDFARSALAGAKDMIVTLIPYVSAAVEGLLELGKAFAAIGQAAATVIGYAKPLADFMGLSSENAKSFANEVLSLQKNLNVVGEALQQGRRALDGWSDSIVRSADKADAASRSFARMMLQIRGDAAALEEFDRRAAAADKRRGQEAEQAARASVLEVKRREEAERTQEASRVARARRRDSEDEVSISAGVPGLAGLKGADMTAEQKQARFAELVAARKKGKLRPSEAAELRRLSKQLDMAIPDKGATHKATKMDKQLAAMDPSLRGLLVRGGERDKGGDLKVSDDPLSRAAFAAAGKKTGLGGISGGSGGVGPGPNITTHNYFNTVNVNQSIDARSSSPVPENIRSSANDAGQRAGQVVITGMDRARAMKQGGGRMA